MISYFVELYNLIENLDNYTFNVYLLIAVSVIIIISFISFVVLFGKKLFDMSNYTIKKIVYIRRSIKRNFKVDFKNLDISIITNISFINRIYENNKLLLEKAGLYTKNSAAVVVLLKWLIIPMFSLLVFILNLHSQNNSFVMFFVTLIFLELLIFTVIKFQIKKEADNFNVVSYKLFKFLRNQLSAGIKITSALNSLHTVTNDKLLKNRLLLLASHFASTNNIDESLKYITDYYQTIEAKSLSLAIKQSIETGQNEKSFVQKEKKLFNLYLNVIKKNTQLLLAKYFIIGILYAAVIILIVTYPQILDLMSANKVMFG